MDHRNYMELSRKERKSGKRVDCIMNMHAHTLTHSSHVVVLLSFFFSCKQYQYYAMIVMVYVNSLFFLHKADRQTVFQGKREYHEKRNEASFVVLG